MRKRLKILSATIALSAVGISSAISFTVNQSLLSNNETSKIISSSIQSDSTSDLVPAQANGQNANISTTSGPVTYWNDTITALDWYGNKLWSQDMSKVFGVTGVTYNGSWKRAWFNWDYNRSQNILWVLGYAYQSEQKVVGLDAATGTIKYQYNLGKKTGTVGSSDQPYKFISALSSGKVLTYGDPVAGYNGESTIYDPTTSKIEKFTGNSVNNVPTSIEDVKFKGTYRWYFFNLVPIANNINIAEVVTFDNGNSTKDDGSANRASYNVYALLVDDNLNFIGNKQGNNSSFKNAVLLAEGIAGYRNTTITPQRDYYTLLNNKTVTVTYNNVSVIDASDTSNIKLTQVKMTDSKWIQTWTVDANDNLYFKFLKDGKVYRIGGDSLKSGESSFSPSTYLDLDGISNESVKNNANNFLIYNVYGYTGELMMVNADYYAYINNYDANNKEPTADENETKLYGLAIAVVPNASDNNSGDFKGLLNTSNSFQKPADFTIEQSVLSSKIPSEITESDIKLLNDAFFKDSDSKPFIISNIDDVNGTFKVTANLYKIPWFATTLPKDSVPKVVTYTFDGKSNDNKAQSISSKVSWKTLSSSANYDFVNMIPSNVTVEDLNALDPFQASFQSQTITKNGEQLYPKTTYSIVKQNDSDGTIEIKAEYKYVPMSATYTNGENTNYEFGSNSITEQQVLTYTSTTTYQIFNKSTGSSFYFMGATSASEDGKTQTVDVTNVPQLKELLSAGTLPSSFDSLANSNDSTNSAFLQFVNTSNSKGYPISKMKFSVQADDTNGTLTINATMPKEYSPDGNEHTYSVKYTNLNKNSSYTFSFNENQTKINDTDISTILPSAVDTGEIIKNFLSYTGFDSNDFNVVLIPNDEQGTLDIQINLDNNYATAIASANGFTNYSMYKTISGFMTTSQYNSRFTVNFKGDDDVSLLDLKSIQAQEIVTAFSSGNKNTNSLKVGDKTYTSLNQLVKDLLVSSQGSSIPVDWSASGSGVTTEVYVDNSLGIASFYVKIKQSSVLGATSDLNFVVTYSGFVKGNIDSTNDNLSFVSDAMLKNYLLSIKAFNQTELDNLTTESFSKWVSTSDNIKKLITYKTGQYITKLDSNSYTVTVTANDLQDTVTITIDFGSMTDSKSLSEYSVQYTI